MKPTSDRTHNLISEVEALLKEGARFQPNTPMPEGLEGKALLRCRTSPKRRYVLRPVFVGIGVCALIAMFLSLFSPPTSDGRLRTEITVTAKPMKPVSSPLKSVENKQPTPVSLPKTERSYSVRKPGYRAASRKRRLAKNPTPTLPTYIHTEVIEEQSFRVVMVALLEEQNEEGEAYLTPVLIDVPLETGSAFATNSSELEGMPTITFDEPEVPNTPSQETKNEIPN